VCHNGTSENQICLKYTIFQFQSYLWYVNLKHATSHCKSYFQSVVCCSSSSSFWRGFLPNSTPSYFRVFHSLCIFSFWVIMKLWDNSCIDQFKICRSECLFQIFTQIVNNVHYWNIIYKKCKIDQHLDIHFFKNDSNIHIFICTNLRVDANSTIAGSNQFQIHNIM